MRLKAGFSRRTFAVMLAAEIAALILFWWFMPRIRRPLEVLLAMLAVMCALTAVAAGPRRAREALLAGTSVFATMFLLELGQKYFDFVGLFQRRGVGVARASVDASADPWSWSDPEVYLDVKRRARAEGILPVGDAFAGDIFSRMDRQNLLIDTAGSRGIELVMESLKPYRTLGPPLGFQLTPGNRVRNYCRHLPTGEMLFDGCSVTNDYGYRETRGNPESREAYIFMGCSVTYGYGLNDDQTMPHYFSEALGFEKRIVNLALSGYGVHQALRELETGYRLAPAGLGPGGVKGVFFGLIDGHIERMDNPRYPETPYYVMRNGQAAYAGSYKEHTGASASSRLYLLLERGRLYPLLRERLAVKYAGERRAELWRITLAMLEAMNRICRTEYGLPLTVIYWDDHQPALARLAELGIRVIRVQDAFNASGDYSPVKYMLHDGHPSAHANKILGRYVCDAIRQTGG